MKLDWKREWKPLAAILAVFLACFWLPVGSGRFDNAITEALHLAKWYAREHVLLCLVPAFFIAGAIGVFVSQGSVMKYLGARAKKTLAYAVAAVSGSVLAVCSCTVLPLFAGIYRMGAGLGPACAFLYAGPAVNVLAIILTARILGLELGIARAIGAVAFSVVIGGAMHLIFRKEELAKAEAQAQMPEPEVTRPLWQNAVFFALMIGVLIFANWGKPNDYRVRTRDGKTFRAAVTLEEGEVPRRFKMLEGPQRGEEIALEPGAVLEMQPQPGVWTTLWRAKWIVASVFAMGLGLVLVLWFGLAWWKVLAAAVPAAVLALLLPEGKLMVMIPFAAGVVGLSAITATKKGEAGEWFSASWGFAKQIMPLLFVGVLAAGLLLGRVGHEGLIPGRYVKMLVGERPDAFLAATGIAGGGAESVVRLLWTTWTNFFASVFGAFMYFATLTEVPILQGLMGAGMGKGPALALLLAGPALSLPNMLVIRSIMGTKKTLVFVALVVTMATVSGMIFGAVI